MIRHVIDHLPAYNSVHVPLRHSLTLTSKMTALHDLATNPQHTKWLYPLLLVADAALCGLIIEYVPCTSTRNLLDSEQIIQKLTCVCVF